MLNFSGYMDGADLDRTQSDRPLSVNSCGHYLLRQRERFDTVRFGGRADYQFLYVARGRAYFRLAGDNVPLGQGSLVLYRPGQDQAYHYLLRDNPEIYWLHFSGADMEATLAGLGFGEGALFFAGVSSQYVYLFDRIIRELQLREPHYREMAELLLLFSRALPGENERADPRAQGIGQVIERIHRDYRQPLSVQDYADMLGVGVCWFIRIFKEQTGVPPHHFLTDVRISKAQELLGSSAYTVGEIAELVGYDNPLYFSRIFRKKTGVSPQQYRSGKQ